jgi:hypothetical protein
LPGTILTWFGFLDWRFWPSAVARWRHASIHEPKGPNMKNAMYALPVVAFCAAAAVAQTDTTTGTDTTGTGTDMTGERFGMTWPLSIGSTFLTGDDNATLRTPEELSSGWESLSEADRAIVEADCQAFLAVHGDAATTGDADMTGDAASTATGDAAADSAATGAADTTAETGDAATSSGDASSSTPEASAATGTDGSMTGSGDASTSTGGTTAGAAELTGYDMAQMKLICDAVEGL